MKVTLNIDEPDEDYLHKLYQTEVGKIPGIDRETLYGRLYSRFKEFGKRHLDIAARALFDWIDDVETRSEPLVKDEQGEFDFPPGTIFALNKTRIAKKDMGAEHWRQKREQVINNFDRTKAAVARVIAICDRHIHDLLGGKAA